MVQELPRPDYDTSKPYSAGESPVEKENAEWIDRRFAINREVLISSLAPSSQTVKPGTARLFRDPNTGRVTMYANSGGQIIDLLSFEV